MYRRCVRAVASPRCSLWALRRMAGDPPRTAGDEDVLKLLDQQPPVLVKHQPGGDGGEREAFDSHNMTLLSWLSLADFRVGAGNDCWGYVSPSGREYAIMGLQGVRVRRGDRPANPVIVGVITGPSSTWHDVKVIGHYAYGVSEGGSGVRSWTCRTSTTAV